MKTRCVRRLRRKKVLFSEHLVPELLIKALHLAQPALLLLLHTSLKSLKDALFPDINIINRYSRAVTQLICFTGKHGYRNLLCSCF